MKPEKPQASGHPVDALMPEVFLLKALAEQHLTRHPGIFFKVPIAKVESAEVCHLIKF